MIPGLPDEAADVTGDPLNITVIFATDAELGPLYNALATTTGEETRMSWKLEKAPLPKR